MNHGTWKRGTRKEDWPEDAILCYGGYLEQPVLRQHTRPRNHWAFDKYQWFAQVHTESSNTDTAYSDTPRGRLLKELHELESQTAEQAPGTVPPGYKYFCTFETTENRYDLYCCGEPSLNRTPWHDGWYAIRTNGWQGSLGNCVHRTAIRHLISEKLEALHANPF